MKHRLSLISRVGLFLLLISATSAFAANVAVGTCLPNKVSFDSITDAVEGVPPGSTIQVCPGVYTEQVVINKSLTLKGVSNGNTSYSVIMPPPSGLAANAFALNAGPSFFGAGTQFAAQVVIQGGVDVTISDMAVDAAGTSLGVCTHVGVLIQDSSATLTRVALKNQFAPGVCSAVGILAQNDGTNATTVKVLNSTFVNAGQAYESDGANNTSTLTNNSFAGNPASNANAISIESGSSTTQGNTISNYNFPADTDNINNASFGILISCASSGTVANNDIAGTQVGIFLSNSCTTSGISVTGNNISDAALIAIDAGGINGLVQGNDIRTSQTAIRLPGASAGNTILNNRINDTCTAFGSNPAAGVNTILTNTISSALNVAIVNTTGLCP